MSDLLIAALRLLSHFWLEEVRTDDLTTIAALPQLAETLPQADGDALTELAVEYQRLFGFNLLPYESIFVDPTAMLLAPATARVQALYRQARWSFPAYARVAAPDHVGLELLALADMQAKAEAKEEQAKLAYRLQTEHLALWVPAFVLTLRRLTPHPFYAVLGELTLDLLLSTLPSPLPFTISSADPFPVLPSPPVYDDQGQFIPLEERQEDTGLRALVKQLLTPCRSGLMLTRADITRISRALDLPTVMGERPYMLETLFQQAGEYELAPALLDQLRQLLAEVGSAYQLWTGEYPAWTPYAEAWRRRVANTRVTLNANEEVP
jgi:TorA maturation chaperone TorD